LKRNLNRLGVIYSIGTRHKPTTLPSSGERSAVNAVNRLAYAIHKSSV